ncbi:MAG: hypothetical protein IJT18_08345 [Oscillospiraceae bacterium]|nr:hypothetical protein [Oscillospiraceae bacterium]
MERKTELKSWRFVMDQIRMGEQFGYHTPAYDHSSWMEVESYRAWETYDDSMFDYEGWGWYYTTAVAPERDKRFVLHFDGVGGVAKVYVNGKLAGETDCRYLPFEVDATDFVTPGEQAGIAVLVDNTCRGCEHLTGGKNTEWVLYGGLTHRVWAEEREPCRVSELHIRAQYDGTAEVEATVENKGRLPFAGKLRLTMPSEVQEVTGIVPAGESRTMTFNFKAENITPWSPDEPKLYECKAEVFTLTETRQTLTERFGYRTVETRGTQLFLNGKPILFMGANRYDEYAPYGNCPPKSKIREDLLEMKNCGMNIIRTHYPQDPEHYEIADEVGIMYMIEVPLNWWNKKADEPNEDFEERSRYLPDEAMAILDGTWRWHGNHPCWTVWSTSNECTHSVPMCRGLFEKLAARMRELRCGRLITNVTNKPILDSEELAFCDFLSLNYYFGVTCTNVAENDEALEKLRDRLATAQKLYPNIPHVMTEFGYPCVAGMRGSRAEGRFTEDRGVTYFETFASQFKTDPQMCGLILWCWADYRHRRTFIANEPQKMGICSTFGPYGMVTIDRKPKRLIYDAVRKLFRDFCESR